MEPELNLSELKLLLRYWRTTHTPLSLQVAAPGIEMVVGVCFLHLVEETRFTLRLEHGPDTEEGAADEITLHFVGAEYHYMESREPADKGEQAIEFSEEATLEIRFAEPDVRIELSAAQLPAVFIRQTW